MGMQYMGLLSTASLLSSTFVWLFIHLFTTHVSLDIYAKCSRICHWTLYLRLISGECLVVLVTSTSISSTDVLRCSSLARRAISLICISASLAFLSATLHTCIIPATAVLSIPYWVQMLVNVCLCFNWLITWRILSSCPSTCHLAKHRLNSIKR